MRRSLFRFVSFSMISVLAACGGAEVTVPHGCEECPERCVVSSDGNRGTCAECLKSDHCGGTRKCIERKCVCGTDKDCPDNSHCGAQGCKGCYKDEHCPTGKVCGEDKDCHECRPGQTRACPQGAVASCQDKATCKSSGTWGGCEGARKPTTEKCDGEDNDCDGKVDNAASGKQAPLSRACYSGSAATRGAGICKSGTESCVGGKWSGKCVGEVLPAKGETCNGKDDDCDGKVDEEVVGMGAACTAAGAKGACAKGKKVCSGGKVICEPGKPSKPVCPGLVDADCDGRLDCEVRIPAGTFMMGSPSSEPGHESNEGPRTKVTLSNRFAMWKYELTQGSFMSLMGYNPSHFSSCGKTCPVEKVNWHEAAAFCNVLSKKRSLSECYDCKLTNAADKRSWSCTVKAAFQGNSGKDYYKCAGYRLPTEAEWKYAYRASTTTAFYNGKITSTRGKDSNLEKIGWYDGNSGNKTHPAGGKAANAWGLYDMAGNVWEWVFDWYADKYPGGSVNDPVGPASGSRRVDRGGGWSSYSRTCRAANRGMLSRGDCGDLLGFRPCRSLSGD